MRVNEVKKKGEELCDDDEKVSQRVRKEKKVLGLIEDYKVDEDREKVTDEMNESGPFSINETKISPLIPTEIESPLDDKEYKVHEVKPLKDGELQEAMLYLVNAFPSRVNN